MPHSPPVLLGDHTVLLDARGIVLASSHDASAPERDGALPQVGADYLALCERIGTRVVGRGREIATLLREVLAGDRSELSAEYSCASSRERWNLFRVQALAGHASARAVVSHENVTSRKTTEGERELLLTRERASRAAAEASRARVTNILESITDGFFTLDASMHFTYMNSRAASLLRRRVQTLVGSPVSDLFPEVTSARFVEMFARAMSSQSPVSFEEFYAPLNTWVDMQAYPAPGGGVSVYFRDVTARKRAEEALRRSEFHYRLLFERNPVPMWLFDVETLAFLDVNDAAIASYGFSRDEFMSMSLAEIWPAEDVPRMSEIVRETQPRRASQHRHRRKDGSIVDVEVFDFDLKFEGRPARMVMAKDVSRRLQSERELREAHEALSTLIGGSPLAIVAVDRTLCVTTWNAAAERLFGWTAAEVVGIRSPVIGDGSEGDEDLAHTLEHGIPLQTLDGETTRLRKDGVRIDVYRSASPIRDADGDIQGAVAFFADIGERKALADQLRQAQRMEAIGQLAGGVAHDFNNLLTVIRCNAEMILDAADAPDAHVEALEIRLATDRASALTRQLLAFSRKQILQPRQMNMSTVVDACMPMLTRLIGEDIEIITRTEQADCDVIADPGQIEQVVINLAVNARDAMPEGGVLTIVTACSSSAPAVGTDPARPGQHVRLRITDTGIGMTEAVRSRIFEPFFTTKPAGQGTGLGLSTVYGIVQQSGGQITVQSAPGEGTTFSIYLPFVASGTTAFAEIPAARRAPRGSETILLVEDEEAVRRLTRRILVRQGYDVIEARDGTEAIREVSARGERIDLVVTDVVMPGMNGRLLVERLLVLRPDMRVLFMSGYTNDDVIRRGVVNPGVHFIQKPFSVSRLAEAVREVLDDHALPFVGVEMLPLPSMGRTQKSGTLV